MLLIKTCQLLTHSWIRALAKQVNIQQCARKQGLHRTGTYGVEVRAVPGALDALVMLCTCINYNVGQTQTR